MGFSPAEYRQIRYLLVHSDWDERKLDKLKTDFKEDINSQRVFERIDSLNYLLKILEKRDAIGPKHVNKLLQIANEVSPGNIEIRNIFFRREGNESSNKSGNGPSDNTYNDNHRIHHGRVIPPVPSNTVERIHQQIKEEIGIKWKELARALSVQEGQIDCLEHRYRYECNGLYRMVDEVLTIHQERYGRNFERWRSALQQALIKARRRDLSEAIDDILVEASANHA